MDGSMRNQGRPHRTLWNACWCAILPLRAALSYQATFMWFATIVVGIMVRSELRGVTSIVRALNLRPDRYNPLRRCFHSTAIKLDQLTALWVQAVLRLFTNPVRVNGRLVLVGDGVKAAKRGRKMPAVKLLRAQQAGQTEALWQEGQAQISCGRRQVDGRGCQPRLRRAQRQDPLSRARSDVAPGRTARALRRRRSSNQGDDRADDDGPVARGHGHHSHLWPSFQDRAHLQAGGASNRSVRLPFLDDGDEAVAVPQWKSVSSSRHG